MDERIESLRENIRRIDCEMYDAECAKEASCMSEEECRDALRRLMTERLDFEQELFELERQRGLPS